MKICINENTVNYNRVIESFYEFKRNYNEKDLLIKFTEQTKTENDIIKNPEIMYCNLFPSYYKNNLLYFVEIGLKGIQEFNIVTFTITQKGKVNIESNMFDIEYYDFRNRKQSLN